MIDTNTLIGAAFSLIAAFTNVVQVPANSVPQKMDDIEKHAVNPTIPTALLVRSRSGVTYSLLNGVVNGYSTPWSWFQMDDIHQIDHFTGDAELSTNVAVDLVARTLRRLSKQGDPLTGLTPQIKQGGEYHGKKSRFSKSRGDIRQASWAIEP